MSIATRVLSEGIALLRLAIARRMIIGTLDDIQSHSVQHFEQLFLEPANDVKQQTSEQKRRIESDFKVSIAIIKPHSVQYVNTCSMKV